MGIARNWTQEEVNYLKDNWGSVSLSRIALNLNRSENAINVKKQKLKLGSFIENGDFITFNQLITTLGNSNVYTSRASQWIEKYNYPIKTKLINKKRVKITYLEDFWTWAEQHRKLIDFSKLEENILGIEPAWVKLQRKLDFEKRQKIKTSPWTQSEDEKLKRLLKEFRYSYFDLSRMINRSDGAIQRRILDLGLKERPIKADNHIKWKEEEFISLKSLIKQGADYIHISDAIGKSAKAIRGKVYALYKTENLDKVRMII